MRKTSCLLLELLLLNRLMYQEKKKSMWHTYRIQLLNIANPSTCMQGIVHILSYLSVCCCFMSKHHLRSYQDGYQLVTVCIYGDFIVLPL